MEKSFRKFEDFIFECMSKTHLPAISVAAVENGQIIYSKGFGLRNKAYGLAATPNTLYAIGSVTKSFTALSIMQLFNEGKLSLEDPVSKYAPLELKSMGEPVKIWHLLTHSSGDTSLSLCRSNNSLRDRSGRKMDSNGNLRRTLRIYARSRKMDVDKARRKMVLPK